MSAGGTFETMVEGEVMAAMPGGDWPALTDAEEKALAERYSEEIARNFDPESQLRALEKDVAGHCVIEVL